MLHSNLLECLDVPSDQRLPQIHAVHSTPAPTVAKIDIISVMGLFDLESLWNLDHDLNNFIFIILIHFLVHD